MKRMAFDRRFVNPAGDGLVKGKIHTIRANYDYWKRFEGKDAALFYWEGKPYRSKQKVFCVKTIRSVVPSAFDGRHFWKASSWKGAAEDGGGNIDPLLLARNDGFESVDEFYKWFEKYKRPALMCIIHFTDFKYTVRDTDNLANKTMEEKKEMKIYISGKISGDRDYRKKFLDAGNRLENAGHHPLSPVTPVSDCTDWQSAIFSGGGGRWEWNFEHYDAKRRRSPVTGLAGIQRRKD
jgi:hypothetical protein